MHRRSLWVRYGAAAGLLVLAFVIRCTLSPLLDHQSPFFLFLPAAMLAALSGGVGPGLTTLAAGLILGDFFFLPPTMRFGPYQPTELTVLVVYLLTGVIGIIMVEEFHRIRKRLEHSQSHERSLEAVVAERTASLQQSVKSLEGVLYHVAHDLRAPLRAMHNFGHLLLENYSSNLDATGRDYARRVSEASLKMDALVHDLLDYGRLGHQEIHWETVDLWDVLEGTLHGLNTEIQRRGAEIGVDPPLPEVWGDPHILQAVFAQVIDNAVTFVAPGTVPKIRIWAEAGESTTRINIQDNGIGIAPEYHQRIFGVFERVHTDDTYPGTGMGLAFVQKAVERLGGQVGVESSPGAGSRFWLELKLAPQAAERRSESTEIATKELYECGRVLCTMR